MDSIDDHGYHLYINKDGRTRAYSPISKKVVSYPRLIMERYLGRPLEDTEQVHHIDGDTSNNDVSNLEVLPFKVHNEIHSVSKYQDKYVKCPMCGVTFLWTAKSQIYFNSNKSRRSGNGPFCSRKCAGLYSTKLKNNI